MPSVVVYPDTYLSSVSQASPEGVSLNARITIRLTGQFNVGECRHLWCWHGETQYPWIVWEIQSIVLTWRPINTLGPRQYCRHFPDDIFECIFLNKNVWIPLKISLKFLPKVRINSFSALVQIRARRRPGDQPLSEPMLVNLDGTYCSWNLIV